MASIESKLREFTRKWHSAVEEKDLDAVMELFAEDARLISPVVVPPITDHNYIRLILTAISTMVVKNFHYTAEFISPGSNDGRMETRGVVLVFAGHLEEENGKKINVEGVDIFRFNEDCNKVTELKVMIRPLKAATRLAQQMKDLIVGTFGGLKNQKSKSSSSSTTTTTTSKL